MQRLAAAAFIIYLELLFLNLEEDWQELEDLQSTLAYFDWLFKLDEFSDIIFAYLSSKELSFSDKH